MIDKEFKDSIRELLNIFRLGAAEYKTIQNSKELIDIDVNNAIKEGWQPVGSCTEENGLVMQTMVRYIG